MGLALLDGVAFRIDPSSVSWDYTVKTAELETVGGKVIQVYGTDLGDMVVAGSFGKGGFAEQQTFLTRMRDTSERQVQQSTRIGALNPSRFLYPPQGWDFAVLLKEFSQPNAPDGASVYVDPTTFNPGWSLTFHVVTENAGIKKAAQNAFIDRLSRGLGWTQESINEGFHGAVTVQDIESHLGGKGLVEYVSSSFGADPQVVAGTGGG